MSNFSIGIQSVVVYFQPGYIVGYCLFSAQVYSSLLSIFSIGIYSLLFSIFSIAGIQSIVVYFQHHYIVRCCLFSACGRDYYKYMSGPDACQPCPANSHTKEISSVECTCYNGYYRAEKDPKSMACTRTFDDCFQSVTHCTILKR